MLVGTSSASLCLSQSTLLNVAHTFPGATEVPGFHLFPICIYIVHYIYIVTSGLHVIGGPKFIFVLSAVML